ncbi:aminotransferase class I and II [Aggregicoccus sp. 17bor-14]|uniref:HipA family kinase n=1 Tax=Myxococcaceae TaxID=31 RepID=UPI00129C15A5|nr:MULTISPECIES: HipA family kinase [Myxococcaceae]MBF5045991.1 aminotransferase class I and II [Simulacricoccus sp. 17bor-14]MRI91722.1 aminotransferase class I and II [Aggregicoccus sp. 17bor-14]
MLRTVTATRYVTPLREGGSLPAILEADDAGLYVVKFRGAGQGVKVLIAELISGELARAAGLKVPELVLLELDPVLGRAEPDSEIRDLLKASAGLNLAMDYLPASITFDPLAGPFPDAATASAVVAFDAFVTNVDRTPKNPNMLCWHRALWLIDHGASLYFHHAWDGYRERARTPFGPIKDHVLLPWSEPERIRSEWARMAAHFTPERVRDIVAAIPEGWLGGDVPFPDVAAHRAAYVDFLLERLSAAPVFIEEAARARAQLV